MALTQPVGDDQIKRLSDRLLSAVAEHCYRGGIPVANHARDVGIDNGVWNAFHDGAEQRLAGEAIHVRPFPQSP